MEMDLKPIIISFVALVIGITLLLPVNQSVNEITLERTNENESIAMTGTTRISGTTALDDVQSVAYFGNGSINTGASGINLNVEVNFTNNGSIVVSATNFTAGTYNITYTYRPDGYLTQSSSRAVTRLITLFFVLAILFGGAALLIKKMQESVSGFKPK